MTKNLVRVCMYCAGSPSSGAPDDAPWPLLDSALLEDGNVEPSHGVCPRCYVERLHPQLVALEAKARLTRAPTELSQVAGNRDRQGAEFDTG